MSRVRREVITPYNVLRHELVGLSARVAMATHEGYLCSGQIVGETRDTIKIEAGGRTRTLPKGDIVLEFDLPGGCRVRVEGRLLVSRPEDRIKKKHRIRFATENGQEGSKEGSGMYGR